VSNADTIDAIVRAAIAAWPQFHVPRELFIAHLEERAADEAALARVRADDLYLACACLARDASAWRELDRLYLAQVPVYVARIDRSSAFADDVRQRLAEKLVWGHGDEPPKLAQYTGRGPLGAWMRVVAIREAQTTKRGEKWHASTDEIPVAAPDESPELQVVKQRYASEFKAAFEDVLKTLSSDQRNVLRLHYLDGLTIEAVGRTYDISRATAARWIADARDAILSRLEGVLVERYGPGASRAANVLAFLQSRIDLSLRRQLAWDSIVATRSKHEDES
jgi:RNA polymerase sigma-70 factor, ECF subfamily